MHPFLVDVPAGAQRALEVLQVAANRVGHANLAVVDELGGRVSVRVGSGVIGAFIAAE